MHVEKIWDADIYRDGGSYGFCFDADDGHWYEFFIKTNAFSDDQTTTHLAPVLYREGCNSGIVVRSFSWAEAKEFTAHLRYSGERFSELLTIVASEGQKVLE